MLFLLNIMVSMNGSLFALVAVGIINTVLGQRNDFWCVGPNLPQVNIAKTDLLYLCIHFMPYNVRLGFFVNVDEHTVLEIPDSYSFFKDMKPEQTQIHAQLDVFPYYSDANTYIIKSQQVVNNVMHLVITLNEGKLMGMRWENGCHGCNVTKPDFCKEYKTSFADSATSKTKEVTYKQCMQPFCTVGNNAECNLKVY